MTEVVHEPTLKEQWQAGLERGELLLQHCNNCGKTNMYPRHFCPFCQSSDLGWVAASGRGVIHSYTVVRMVPPRGFEVPYCLAVVKLEEGVQLTARLVPAADGTWDHYACDAPVVFSSAQSQDTSRGPVAWFALGDAA